MKERTIEVLYAVKHISGSDMFRTRANSRGVEHGAHDMG